MSRSSNSKGHVNPTSPKSAQEGESRLWGGGGGDATRRWSLLAYAFCFTVLLHTSQHCAYNAVALLYKSFPCQTKEGRVMHTNLRGH